MSKTTVKFNDTTTEYDLVNDKAGNLLISGMFTEWDSKQPKKVKIIKNNTSGFEIFEIRNIKKDNCPDSQGKCNELQIKGESTGNNTNNEEIKIKGKCNLDNTTVYQVIYKEDENWREKKCVSCMVIAGKTPDTIEGNILQGED